MVDNYEEPNPPRASHDDTDNGADADMTGHVEPRPFAVRLRMIILLSLICWMLLIAVVVWIVG